MMLLGNGESRLRAGSYAEWIGEAGDLVDHMLRNVAHGRFERSSSAMTAVIYLEHYKAGFDNKWM